MVWCKHPYSAKPRHRSCPGDAPISPHPPTLTPNSSSAPPFRPHTQTPTRLHRTPVRSSSNYHGFTPQAGYHIIHTTIQMLKITHIYVNPDSRMTHLLALPLCCFLHVTPFPKSSSRIKYRHNSTVIHTIIPGQGVPCRGSYD